MTAPHPKIVERRAAVEDQTVRSRHRKMIIFAAVLGAVLLAAAATQSALLDVDEIRIVGAARTSPDVLRATAGVEPGTPLLGLDTDAIEARLLELPEVATVTASSSWGGVVTVEINERLPVARIDSDGGTVLVAADGLVLDVVPRVPVATTDHADEAPSDQGPSDETPSDQAPSDETPSDDAPVAFEPLAPDVAALPEIAGAIFTTERGRSVPDVLTDALEVATELPADIAVVTERVEITVDSLVLRTVGGGDISLGDARDLELKFDAIRAFLAQVDLSCLETLNVRAPSVPVITRASNC